MRILLLLLLLATCSAHAQENLLRAAIHSFGLDSSSIGYRPRPTWGTTERGDPFRLHYFDGLLADPLRIPGFTRGMLWRYNLWLTGDSANFPRPRLAGVRPLAGLIFNSARNIGQDVGKYGFDYKPGLPAAKPLLKTIRELYRNGRDLGSNIVYPLPTQDWSDISERIEAQIVKMPDVLQEQIATIVTALGEAAEWRNRSIRKIPAADLNHIYHSTTLEESQCDAHTFDQVVYDAALSFDGRSASYGAMLLAQAVEKTLPALEMFRGQNIGFEITTPLGRILISGGGENIHYAQDCALLVDLGGNDMYYGRTAATSPDLPVSVLIDIDGDDSYVNDHEGIPSQAAGVLGIALLLDLEGNDTYDSKTFSQGCGRFGVGVLFDRDGSDRYTSLGFSQGAGLYGLGILFDKSGDDEYHTVYYAQGYGFSLGLGLLADTQGNDRYVADDTELIHVGDETPKHNESDAQGFGSGRRGDHTDGHNMSGGLGILTDLEGSDEYSSGVFAQGSGYWYGYGVLNDRQGDDVYRGVFFNLGAAAHYSIGVLFDDAGNDRSDLVMTLGLGTAHDASAAIYIDSDGDDEYRMTDADDRACSLGSSLNNSFALFANIRGNDLYAPVGNALGYAVSRRAGEWAVYAPSTGLFFDIGGTDTYEYRRGGNNSSWEPETVNSTKGIFGLGRDTAQGMLRFQE